MAEPKPDLEVSIGVTVDRLARQLAQAEARMVKAANRSEKRWRAANQNIGRSFDHVSRRATRASAIVDGFGTHANRSSRTLGGFSHSLRMASLQINQVAQQGAITGNYIQALSVQMPDLLLAFGTFGALAGVAAGALIPFIANLRATEDANQKLIESLVGGEVGFDSIQSSMSQLRDIQDTYNEAIKNTAGASSATAAVVAANSAREFAARKQVLAIELELLRIRGAEQRSQLAGLQEAARAAGEEVQRSLQLSGENLQSLGPGPGGVISPDLYDMGAIGRRLSARAEQELAAFQESNAQNRRAIRMLRAEIELTELAAEQAGAALAGEFADVGSGGDRSKSKKGGGGKGENAFERQARQIRERTAAILADTEAMRSINPLVDDYGFALEKAGAEQALLTAAEREGITVDAELRAGIEQLATAYANATVEAKQLKESQEQVRRTAEEMRSLGRDVMGGFIKDLMNGKSAADALSNALGRVADKLLEMALNDLFSGKGGGGGFLGAIFGGLFGNAAGNAFDRGRVVPFARGGAFDRGQVTAFAAGGVVSRPTLFPMANGAGLMGEAGPEAILPLRRGAGGRLGVEANGAGGAMDVTIRLVDGDGNALDAQRTETAGGIQFDVVIDQVVGDKMTRSGTAINKALRAMGGQQPLARR